MGADAESSAASPRHRIPEKREPVSDIDIAVADSLKVLDLKRPIREADMPTASAYFGLGPTTEVGSKNARGGGWPL